MHRLHSLNDWQLNFLPTVAWSTWENRLGAKQEQRLRYGNNDTAPMHISNHTQFNSYENLHRSEEAKAKAALERHTPASKASIKKTFPSNPAFVQPNHWLWWNFGWSCLQKPMFETQTAYSTNSAHLSPPPRWSNGMATPGQEGGSWPVAI